MASFIIEGGHKLSGTIRPQGAKNEALQVISAVLLTGEKVTISNIPEILDAGIDSLKIEGRMKRPEYVAAATSACRQALDNGRVEAELESTLKNVFSRSGFTSGYLENKLGRDMFGIRTKEDVVSADKAFPILHELYRKEYKSIGRHLLLHQ